MINSVHTNNNPNFGSLHFKWDQNKDVGTQIRNANRLVKRTNSKMGNVVKISVDQEKGGIDATKGVFKVDAPPDIQKSVEKAFLTFFNNKNFDVESDLIKRPKVDLLA